MSIPASHIHVSERETSHRWPDGRWDNARWEDCAWDVAVELVRAMGHTNIPATHAEAERLRAQAGEDTWSGSSYVDTRRGILRRYRITLGPTAYDWDTLWARLVPGSVASVAGSMGVFSRLHRLRRHDRAFSGTHQVFVYRPDWSPRVWWCDPLAPNDGYRGEWVTKAELAAFVRGARLGSFVEKGVFPPVPSPALIRAIAQIRVYIGRLTAVKDKTKQQIADLAKYRKRLTEYLNRLKGK